ncbi:DUF1654 domain-containing protein [Pseudomonas sp. 1 R 17]|jgi:hypothetical protein|uniref:DUF1654 domain-containing protein n=1 Tax=Pseudomonas sp. 1 R 17 TaxID=1844091 RepID=UPI0008121EAC|nr:DUF1654 domain-containing protein [Pseudomonas sp. 1 R 17]SAM35787.1 hypothetical protein BN1864_LIB5394:05834 [Pseudomonas sp. 1 R 17]
MAKKKKQESPDRVVMSGLESLGLRVSSMINHPVAQQQRWVTIHRLDTDGDREWEEVMSLLSETDGIEMTFNDDGTVTLKWEASTDDDPSVQIHDELSVVEEEPAPF